MTREWVLSLVIHAGQHLTLIYVQNKRVDVPLLAIVWRSNSCPLSSEFQFKLRERRNLAGFLTITFRFIISIVDLLVTKLIITLMGLMAAMAILSPSGWGG